MNWLGRLSIAVVAFAALALGFVLSSTAHAAPRGPIYLGRAATPPETLGAGTVLDAESFREVAAITERITPYLFVAEDGTVQLRDVTAADLGVTEQFLADYRAAMAYSNELILAGEVSVSPDMKVTVRDRYAPDPADTLQGVPGASVDAAEPQAAVPDWGAWNYNSGAMFYNSYGDWTYYRNTYYGLCNSMAAYVGYPWMSRNLIYFYGYNQQYFQNYCYNPMGTYYYMPYSYCYSGLGYKPAYFWTRTYAYYGSCGCYQYQWAWQGFWCRY